MYGTAIAKNTWGYHETGKTQRLYLPDTSGVLQPVVQRANIVERDGPCFEVWDPYMVVMDPNGRDPDSMQYIILRSWVTKDYLLENRLQDDGTGLYRNVDKLIETSAPSAKQETAHDSFLGGTQQKRAGMFLLEEVWTDSTLIVIGNGQVLLRAEANPYWHGRKPIVVAQTRPDFFEPYGISETDMVSDIQATMQTLQNMILDALKLTVLRGVTYREGSVVDPAMINLRPEFKWGVTDHDDVRAFEVPQLGSDVYQMLSSLLGDMERVTGVSAYLTGADSSTINQTTATGVTALQSAANTALKFKAGQLHDKVFQRTYEQWGDLIQQYMTDGVELEISGSPQEAQDQGFNVIGEGSAGKTWIHVDPHEVNGHFRFRLEGSEESISRQTERAEANQALQAATPLIVQGLVNAEPFLLRFAAANDIMPPESILPPKPAALPPAAPNGQPPNGQPFGQPNLMNGQPLPAVAQQAVTAGQ